MESPLQKKQHQKKITWPEFREMEIPEGDTSIYELINGEIVKTCISQLPASTSFS